VLIIVGQRRRVIEEPAIAAVHESGCGPRLPTSATQQVGSCLGYTGRAANVIAKAALDPGRLF